MPFARTVLGDVAPEALGVVYAHEHLVINGGRPVQLFPDFQLADVDKAVAELAPAQALGLRTVVDAMPADCGRDAAASTMSATTTTATGACASRPRRSPTSSWPTSRRASTSWITQVPS